MNWFKKYCCKKNFKTSSMMRTLKGKAKTRTNALGKVTKLGKKKMTYLWGSKNKPAESMISYAPYEKIYHFQSNLEKKVSQHLCLYSNFIRKNILCKTAKRRIPEKKNRIKNQMKNSKYSDYKKISVSNNKMMKKNI